MNSWVSLTELGGVTFAEDFALFLYWFVEAVLQRGEPVRLKFAFEVAVHVVEYFLYVFDGLIED